MQLPLLKFCQVVLLIFSFRSTNSGSFRKIKEGKNVEVDMNFMVYLVKASHSPQLYDAWICGGVIVTADFIVTSAACVEDVQYMYAVAGYNKYVNGKDVETDECTKNGRKKIVFTCVPKSYDFTYEKVERWSFIDIAVVQVESPYDFSVKVTGCTWAPNVIDINYDPKYQEPNTDAMVLGWGHSEKWRLPGDTKDYNNETLQYSSILLMSKSECKEKYATIQGMVPIIDKYMICAMNEGNIDDKGNLRSKVTPDPTMIDGCKSGSVRVGGQCQPNQAEKVESLPMATGYQPRANPFGYKRQDFFRMKRPFQPNREPRQRPIKVRLNQAVNPRQGPINVSPRKNVNTAREDVTFDDIAFNFRRTNNATQDGSYNYTRKAGICQNDHGGPIVTWVGKHEVLIGVASVFRVNHDYHCDGPYLFTSTQCNGAFLNCILNQMAPSTPAQSQTTVSSWQTTIRVVNSTRTNLTFFPTLTSIKPTITTSPQPKTTTTRSPTSKTREPDIETLVNKHKYNGQELFKRPNSQAFYNDYEEIPNPADVVEQPDYDETFQDNRRSSDFCNLPPEQKGFDMVERRISWRNHPDGPAQNELIEDLFHRPVRPLGEFS